MAGLNQNVPHEGTLWHVQTELDGISQSLISTHIFHNGAVIITKNANVSPELPKHEVDLMVQKHHYTVIAALKAGRFDKDLPGLGAPSHALQPAHKPPSTEAVRVIAATAAKAVPDEPPPKSSPSAAPPASKQQAPPAKTAASSSSPHIRIPTPNTPPKQEPAPPPVQQPQPPVEPSGPAIKRGAPTSISRPLAAQAGPARSTLASNQQQQPNINKAAAPAPSVTPPPTMTSSMSDRIISACRPILEPEREVMAFGIVGASNNVVHAAYPVHCNWSKAEVESALSGAAEIFYVATRYGADSNWSSGGKPDEVFLITRQCYEYVAPIAAAEVAVLLTNPALPQATGRALLRRCLERLKRL